MPASRWRAALCSVALALLLLSARAAAAETIDQALTDFAARIGKAQDFYDGTVEKATTETVKTLEGIAHRSARAQDATTQASAWKEVLRLARDHEEACAFFSAQGQLAKVLKELADDDADAQALGVGLHATAGPKIRTRRILHAALVAQTWDTPNGGVITVASTHAKELQFSGAGTLDTQGKIAILPIDLGTDWVLKGDCLHLGTACAGFVVGYTSYNHTGVLWYAEGDNAGAVYTLDGTSRTRTAEATLGCPVGVWLPFSITRKDNQVQITIGDKRYQLTLPPGHQGERFGLQTFYKETSIELANLVLTLNPHEIAGH